MHNGEPKFKRSDVVESRTEKKKRSGKGVPAMRDHKEDEKSVENHLPSSGWWAKSVLGTYHGVDWKQGRRASANP